jgi:hypothetical protein
MGKPRLDTPEFRWMATQTAILKRQMWLQRLLWARLKKIAPIKGATKVLHITVTTPSFSNGPRVMKGAWSAARLNFGRSLRGCFQRIPHGSGASFCAL